MKKIFVIVAIVATMILSASCVNNRKPAEPAVNAVEVVDSLDVAVDSVAVEAPVDEAVAE